MYEFHEWYEKKFHWDQKKLEGENIEISAIWEKAEEKRMQTVHLKANFSK